MAHPAQRRDDKVTVSRSSPRGRARGCDPNGSLQRGSRKRERSPGCTSHTWAALSPAHARTKEDRNEKRRSSRERRKNGRKVGGGRGVRLFHRLFFSTLSVFFLLAPPNHFFPRDKPDLSIK